MLLIVFLSGCTERFHTEKEEGFILIKNEGGATLGFALWSVIKTIVTIVTDFYSFKTKNPRYQVEGFLLNRKNLNSKVRIRFSKNFMHSEMISNSSKAFPSFSNQELKTPALKYLITVSFD